MYSDPNDADLGLGVDGGLRPAKKKIVRRKKDGDDAGDGPSSSAALPPHDENTQIVSSEAEGNALVKRIRQLEGENSALSHSLATICEENAGLTAQIDALCDKVAQLASTPWKGTSVLHSLFEPEKTGWFGGSKSAARDQLEKLSEALQAEFMEYKMAHATTNEEVQALMTALKAAEVSAATLAKKVDQQQQQLSKGPFTAVIQIVHAEGTRSGSSAVADNAVNSSLTEELKQQQALVRSLRSELDAARAASSATASGAPEATTVENLRREVQRLQASLNTEAAMHEHMKTENAALLRQLTERQTEVASLRGQLAASSDASMRSASSAGELQRVKEELRQAKSETEATRRDLEATQKKLLDASNTYEKKYAAIEAKLVESQSSLSQKETALSRTVPTDQYSKLDLEKNALQQELSLCKDRIKYLEEKQSKDAKEGSSRSPDDTINATMVLETLDKNKEKIARLEFEASQLKLQLQQAQAYAVSRDEDARRLERSTAEDKQRVAFLLKKCASVTADTRAVTAARDQLSEQLEKLQTENKKQKRQLDDIPALRAELETVKKEKQQMEARLSSVQELEDRLVKAKETIAYMELAQTRTINMSQYAELQAAKDKLENTMEPLRRKLDDANKEIERLKSVTDAQQAVTAHQKSNVQDWQEKMDSLTASEARLREKVTLLTAENDRLQQLNHSLELQMTNMQDGIKEMAVQMERERSTARQSATASTEKEMTELRLKLEQANTVIAGIEANEAGVIAEPLYKSVVAERDGLSEELKRKSTDLEKLKSEILIYRQTIDELETENDDNVKKIESLQDKYQAERSSLTERLSSEQNRAADLSVDLETAHEEIAKKDDLLKEKDETIRQLEEKTRVQQRAYEDKCRTADMNKHQPITPASPAISSPRSSATAHEGGFGGVVADSANQSSSTDPQHSAHPPITSVPTATSSAVGAATVNADDSASGAMNARIYQLQCDNDSLRGDLKRLQLRYKMDSDEDQRMIGMLQAQVRSRLPATDRTAYEAEINRSAALKKSNAALMDENESLRKALEFSTAAARGAVTTGVPPTSSLVPSSPSNSGAAVVSEAQMKVVELQKKVAEQATQLEAERARVADLEHELHQQREHASNDHGDDDDVGADDDERDSSPLNNAEKDKPHKKKVKKVRKKKTLSEQVAGMDPLAAVMTDDAGAAAEASAADAQLTSLQADNERAQRELAALRSENTKLKSTISDLQQELQNALDDFDTAQADMANEREELQKQIRGLQSMSRQASSALQMPSSNNSIVGTGSFGGKESFAHQNVRDLECQIRSMKDENERLHEENRRMKNASLKHERHASAHLVSMEACQETIRQLEAEIKVLKEQLVPAKQKLAEYMALADRLGIRYPFPAELEGATVLRLKALHLDAPRAMSAPQPTGRSAPTPAASIASPPPRPPRRTGRQMRSQPDPTEDFSLR